MRLFNEAFSYADGLRAPGVPRFALVFARILIVKRSTDKERKIIFASTFAKKQLFAPARLIRMPQACGCDFLISFRKNYGAKLGARLSGSVKGKHACFGQSPRTFFFTGAKMSTNGTMTTYSKAQDHSMRQGPNGRRSRNRHHSGGQHGQHNSGNPGNAAAPSGNAGNSGNRQRSASSLRHQNFDSNCIDVRVRGNAWQVHEKYLALARDAQSGGDRISAENFLQHAEHYFRIIEAINEATALEQRQRAPAPAFNQQPEIPSGYFEGGQQGVSGGARAPAQVVPAHADEGPARIQSHASSVSAAQQSDYRNQQIPPALTDPFFGSEERDEGDSSLERVIER